MNRSLILLIALCTACSAHRAAAPQSRAPESRQDPMIVKLVGRETTLVARASQSGPTYSIESKDGRVIVPAQSLQQLCAERPAVAREVQTLQASVYAGLE
jgi:hypothetical protein